MIIAPTPPRAWNIELADLKSRLCSLPAVPIHQPDDEALTLLLVKLFNDKQLSLTPATLTYILQRIPRSFSKVQQYVDLIDGLSLALHREITVPLARQAFEVFTQTAQSEESHLQLDHTQDLVSQ